MSSSYKKICPDCGHAIRVRNSVGMHELYREVYFECTNISCGATFSGTLEIKARLSPPAIANPKINLPVADFATRRRATSAGGDDNQLGFNDLLDPVDEASAITPEKTAEGSEQ